MNDHSKGLHREATMLARLLLDWHSEVGTRSAQQRMTPNSETLSRYLHQVAEFAESDLSDARTQVAIARHQLSGMFEWSYGEEIPSSIIHRWLEHVWSESGDYFPLPSRLSEVAKRILAINDQLPLDSPVQEENGRTVVRFSDHGDLRAKSRHIYSALTREEDVGIGGANFLLACSIERHGLPDARPDRSNEITLIDETVLGVELVPAQARRNDLLDHLRSKALVVKAVLGEPKQPSADDRPHRNREE